MMNRRLCAFIAAFALALAVAPAAWAVDESDAGEGPASGAPVLSLDGSFASTDAVDGSVETLQPAVPSTFASANTPWKRLWGNSEFDTMRKIVGTGWAKNSGGTVVLATSINFQDALSASAVAGKYKAPILITGRAALTSQTKAELDRIRPKSVIIVGGNYVVTPAVERTVKNLSYVKSVKRVKGTWAWDTAAALARTYFPKGTTTTAFVATASSFPDALSASPVAYAKGYPVFLTNGPSSISQSTLSAIKACGIANVVIVGGKKAVAPSIESKLRSAGVKSIVRKDGSTLYDTSRAVANWAISSLKMSPNKMGVACGTNYPDALCGGALCGKNGSVLVLADDKDRTNASVPRANKSKMASAYVFGGKNAVGSATYSALVSAAPGQSSSKVYRTGDRITVTGELAFERRWYKGYPDDYYILILDQPVSAYIPVYTNYFNEKYLWNMTSCDLEYLKAKNYKNLVGQHVRVTGVVRESSKRSGAHYGSDGSFHYNGSFHIDKPTITKL